MMKRYFSLITFLSVLAALATDFSASGLMAQVESPALSFNRGKLWQSVYNGKIGPQYSNWRKIGIGLDWPGFEPSWFTQDIGGSPSYLVTGGLYVGCKKTNDSVLVAEDWCISGGTVAPEKDSKYKITRHSHLFKDGGNYWLKSSPLTGEEVIETIWEYNLDYTDPAGIRRQLPVRVKRSAHNWSGSMEDENYILYEYVIKNISNEIKSQLTSQGNTSRINVVPDTLKEFYALLTYALHANSRAWTVNFPNEPAGARNTWFFTEPKNNLIYGKADDYTASRGVVEASFGHTYAQGLLVDGEPQGEFVAPGFVGYSLIYSSPNSAGKTTAVNKYGWSAGDNTFDFSGPFANMDTEELQYAILKDPSKAKNPVSAPNDSLFMRRSRMWSLMSVGPWNLAPGDSIVLAVAELVDGADYKLALQAADSLAERAKNLQNIGKKRFDQTLQKAKFTYEQKLANRGFNHPDPPAAPRFNVGFWPEREQFVANLITWDNSTENDPDPDDGQLDLAGYKLYRSGFLPIGPWELIGTVSKGDTKFFSTDKSRYEFVDSTVEVGRYYYYALTAYDNGRTSWNINNGAANPYNNRSTSDVKPMESSIFANRFAANIQFNQPFLATPPAPQNLDNTFVVPNPAVGAQGVSSGVELNTIQFVNVPNPCTIRIYTVRGDLVKTLNVANGSGAIVSWDQSTDFGQWVGSGIYIYHIESALGNKIGKLAIVK